MLAERVYFLLVGPISYCSTKSTFILFHSLKAYFFGELRELFKLQLDSQNYLQMLPFNI